MKKTFQFAEVEIAYKRKATGDPILITSSKKAEEVFRQVFPENKIEYKEMFFVLLLNRRNEVLGVSQIGIGNASGVLVDSREIFTLALKSASTGIILAHNHPSGQSKPSHADIQMTKRIKSFADMIDVILLDHIILTTQSYTSMIDEGYI